MTKKDLEKQNADLQKKISILSDRVANLELLNDALQRKLLEKPFSPPRDEGPVFPRRDDPWGAGLLMMYGCPVRGAGTTWELQ